MLFKSKPGEGHHHLYFVPDDVEGEYRGVSTTAKEHDHEFFFDGELAYCIEANGHTHFLVEVENKPKPKIDKEDDGDTVADVLRLFRQAYQQNIESYEAADESEAFRKGDHWDEEDKQTLEKANRACLTINESGAQIDSLMGYQRNNRSDHRFRPVEESDALGGQICDEVVKNINELNNFVYEESNVAENQAVAGMGNFQVYMDFDSNIEGDITVERSSWRNNFWGPHEKLDASDCEYMVKQKMFSMERLKRMFPDKADDIQKDYDWWSYPAEKRTISGMEYSEVTGQLTIADDGMPRLDIEKKEYRLIECWRKHYRMEHILVDETTGQVENITGVDKRIREMLEGQERYKVIRRTVFDMRSTLIAGNVLLEDDIVDLPEQEIDFDTVPVYAYFQNGKWWGKMEGMKDVQREINHRHSQTVDIVNKAVSYMWFKDGETFANPSDEVEFEERASEPGFVATVADLNRIPLKVDGGKVPVEVIQLMHLSTDKMYRIANVPMESQGDSKMEISGAAIREKTQVALQANRFLWDNMNMAKKKVAKKIIALVQKYYTPERILRLIRGNGTTPGQPSPLDDQQDEAILKILTTKDLTKYDLVMDSSPYSPTIRMSNQILLQELMKQGAPVPFPYFVDQSDLPNKEELLAMFQSDQDREAQNEQNKQQTEIQKAQIAQQGRAQRGGVGG